VEVGVGLLGQLRLRFGLFVLNRFDVHIGNASALVQGVYGVLLGFRVELGLPQKVDQGWHDL